MKDYWFVDDGFRVLSGEAARGALQNESDAPHLSESQGIVQIPPERWEKAQTFERTGWMDKWADESDDRNRQHMADFDDYRVLSGRHFRHAIELGCGPFTNLRLIGQVCQIDECTLLDPLIQSYLTHRHCSYTEKVLRCGESGLSRRLAKPKLMRGLRRVIRRLRPAALETRIPVQALIPSPIETMPVGKQYDLVVIINVIEHCYDINLVFEAVHRLGAPGGVLIFHDKYYDHEQVARLVNGHYYEAGHPLMVDRKLIDGFLSQHFVPMFRKTFVKQIAHVAVMPEYEGLFFIGQYPE